MTFPFEILNLGLREAGLVVAVLIGVIVLFSLGVLWLRRLAGVETPERFLVQSHRRGAERLDVVVAAGGERR